MMQLRRREVNGGRVSRDEGWHLLLPPTPQGYANAQLDDYGPPAHGRFLPRLQFPYRPGLMLQLRARFSHPAGRLLGTAGFGFWNAPYGDPSVRRPALPQAVWFFFGSAPGDLPLAARGPGQGWFASTLDAGAWPALSMIPLAPAVLLLSQNRALRRRLWPAVRRYLGISFAPIRPAMDAWHTYTLTWLPEGCTFRVDGQIVLQTPFSPRGPLGFVCWVDNQYLVARVDGRFSWGTLPTTTAQWLQIQDLQVT